MISKIPDVPLIGQNFTGTCWYASASMLAEWSTKRNGADSKMIHPKDHTDTKQMHDRNSSFPADGAKFLIKWLNMRAIHRVPEKPEEWLSLLVFNGPVWAAGSKHWEGSAYGHVVVVCGVADTGLYIHDPEPMKQGRGEWRTWASMNKYFSDGESVTKLLATPIAICTK